MVADEVRKLAERSHHSAVEVEGFIQRTQEAVAAGDRGLGATLDHLGHIRGAIHHIAGHLGTIGSLSAHEAGTGARVHASMETAAGRLADNARATQRLAASLEEVARTSEDLARVAQGLREVVQGFKV